MENTNYLYNFKFDLHLTNLCNLECRQLFGKEPRDKLLFSKIKLEPSISPFIKNRLKIITQHKDYSSLLERILALKLSNIGFKVEYLVLNGDHSERPEKRARLKDVGYRINAIPNFEKPSIIYAISNYEGIWYFGILKKHTIGWHNHNNKPYSFSSSLDIKIAKSIVCSVSRGKQSKKILGCCF